MIESPTEFVRRIAPRTLTLDEILKLPSTSFFDELDLKTADRRINAWSKSSSAGDSAQFEMRLSRDGLALEDVRSKFAREIIPDQIPSDPWHFVAARIVEAIENNYQRENAAEGFAKPYPFSQVLDAIGRIVQDAVALNRACAEDELKWPMPTDTSEIVLKRLASLWIPPLYQELQKFKRNLSMDNLSGNEKEVIYDDFIGSLRRGGARKLIDEFPVLLRISAEIVKDWISFAKKFQDALSEDYELLCACYEIAATDSVTEIVPVGDLHDAGQCVLLVVFGSGKRVLFKPRDLSSDNGLNDLVEKLNKNGAPIDLRVPRVIVRKNHGWAEYIEHIYCETNEDLAGFFFRCGAWLAIFKAIRACDMHEENIIANGRHPVPIDLETIFQPEQVKEVSVSDPRYAFTQAGRSISGSVWATGFLPGFGLDAERSPAVHGGLLQATELVRAISWSNLDSADLAPIVEHKASTGTANMPSRQASEVRVESYAQNIAEGYREYAKHLKQCFEDGDITHELAAFERSVVRVLRRNTRFYSWLTRRLSDYRSMRDAVVWSAQADFVSRLANWTDHQDEFWSALEYERKQLCLLNIPKFEFDNGLNDWCWQDGAGRVHSSDPSGVSQCFTRLATWGTDEISRESAQIRASLVGVMDVATCAERRRERIQKMRGTPVSANLSELLAAEVDRIAESVMRDAHVGSRSAAWLGLDWRHDSTIFQISPMGADMYNGGSGIALFLASYGRFRNSQLAKTIATDAFGAVRHDIKSGGIKKVVRSLSRGGLVGCGSLVFSMAKTADLVGDRDLLADAAVIARSFMELGTDAATMDLMDGLAGDICALIALYRLVPDHDILAHLRLLGEHLIEGVGINNKGTKSILAAGVSHGLSGSILALSRLTALFPSDAGRYLGVIEAWMDLENGCFDSEAMNWPDQRQHSAEGAVRWLSQWCHGSVGIGLSRMAAAIEIEKIEGSHFAEALVASMRFDVQRSLNPVLKMWPYPSDSLCCGSLAGIELLRRFGEWEKSEFFLAKSAERLAEVVAEANINGGYLWDTDPAVENLGLFRGLSGVGWTALSALGASAPDVVCLS